MDGIVFNTSADPMSGELADALIAVFRCHQTTLKHLILKCMSREEFGCNYDVDSSAALLSHLFILF
jgi:hypothetical protein